MAPAPMTLEELTSASYSYDRYRNWRGVVSMLVRRGYDDRQVEAILLSKWTRWAAEDSRNPRYGYATGADLARFLDNMTDLAAEVASLTAEHFAGAEHLA